MSACRNFASAITASLILQDALEQQLGLKLVDAKAPFDFVMIDRGDTVPTEN